MALNRFYQSGQSQYVSQYVPHKLPFELWQQNIAQADQKIDLTKQDLLAQQTSETAGIDEAKLGEYSSEYFINNPELRKLIKDPGSFVINDRQKSIESANALNSGVQQLLSDDFLFKAATGDIADDLIKLQQLRIQHDQNNTLYKQREAALGDIYKEVSSKKAEWELDPTLLMEQEREIQMMESKPDYIPKNVGIGKYFDSSAYILNELQAKKDSGGKSFDTSDPAYLKWSSSHGVSAGEYAAFATDIFENTGSQVRRDAERRVDELIRSSHIKESDRATALQSELDQLIQTGINLQHRTSDKGMSEKSQGQRDYEKSNQIFMVDAADQQVINAKSTSFNTLESTYNKVGENIVQANEFFKIKYGIDPESLIGIQDKNLLNQQFQAIANQLGIPAYAIKDQFNQYEALHYQYQTLEDNYQNGKNIIESTTGYNDSERSTENLLNSIKQNPAMMQKYLTIAENPNDPQYRQVINSPEYKELLTIKNNKPELYNSLVSTIENQNLLALYSSEDFKTNGVFNPSAANDFLISQGIETGITKGSPALYQFTESDFNKILRNNNTDLTIHNVYNEIISKKNLYNDVSGLTFELSPQQINTSIGINMNIDKAYRQQLQEFSNPYLSTLSTSSGMNVGTPEMKQALINSILKVDKDVNVTMIDGNTYKLDGTALNSFLIDTGSNYQVFLDEYAMEKYETTASDLSIEQMKEMQSEIKTMMSGESTFNLTLKVDGSSQFNDMQSDKITQHNINLNWTDPSKTESNLQYVYSENSINNKLAIKQADELSSKATIVTTGQTVSPNLTRSEQIPFTITAYVDNTPVPLSYTLVGINQSVDQSTANSAEVTTKNTNGTTNTTSFNTGVGYNTQGNIIDNRKIYIYTFRDGNGNIQQIPATNSSEAIEVISNQVNTQ